ncbi:hypothetical protein CC78DRAFT_613895 [Lojkania enalia]|uniref:Uncharacterized protein n=1 Tax=Lojkania enalia TaxID=147567 RepID=A0A9P4KFT1_9PLEO|nr:hypothetical protein CC78DRAFT_613895 [Didymosphaeria enalia]
MTFQLFAVYIRFYHYLFDYIVVLTSRMAFSNATCQTTTSIVPNITQLSAIARCQAAANTTYCYPPNGTRICVPIEDVPFYWPKAYYHSDSRIAIEYDLSSWFIKLEKNDTSNGTQDFTPYMYTDKAISIPGRPYEKTMKIYLLERRFNDFLDPYNLEIHEGPELTLVKTAEFPSTTQSSSFASPTSTYRHDHDEDSHGLARGNAVGIAIGVVAGTILLGTLYYYCCIRSSCASKNYTRNQNANQREPEAQELPRRPMASNREPRSPGAVPFGNTSNPTDTLRTNTDPSGSTFQAYRSPQHREDDTETLPPYPKDGPPPYAP